MIYLGGKGSGRRDLSDARAKSPVTQSRKPEVPPEDRERHTAAMVFGRALFELALEPIDLADADQVKERFYTFLDMCDREGLRPMVTGLAMAFGMTRQQLCYIGRGDTSTLSTKLTAKSRDAVKKAYEFMQVNWEINLQAEKGNPVKWIVLGKNYYGIKDQTEQIVTRRDETAALPSPEETAAKYAGLVGRPMQEAIPAEVVSVEPVEGA